MFLAVSVDGAVHVPPHASNLDVGLIDEPASPDSVATWSRRVTQQRCKPLYPTVKCHVIHDDTTLGKQFVEVTVGQPEPQIPAHRPTRSPPAGTGTQRTLTTTGSTVRLDDGVSSGHPRPPARHPPTQQCRYANCAWDAFGVCAPLDVDGRIDTSCADCGEPITVEGRDEQPDDEGLWFHCLVPAVRWWDDIVIT
jgi:hypothetical protein